VVVISLTSVVDSLSQSGATNALEPTPQEAVGVRAHLNTTNNALPCTNCLPTGVLPHFIVHCAHYTQAGEYMCASKASSSRREAPQHLFVTQWGYADHSRAVTQAEVVHLSVCVCVCVVDRRNCALDCPLDSACHHNSVAAPCRKAPSHMTVFFMACQGVFMSTPSASLCHPQGVCRVLASPHWVRVCVWACGGMYRSGRDVGRAGQSTVALLCIGCVTLPWNERRLGQLRSSWESCSCKCPYSAKFYRPANTI